MGVGGSWLTEKTEAELTQSGWELVAQVGHFGVIPCGIRFQPVGGGVVISRISIQSFKIAFTHVLIAAIDPAKDLVVAQPWVELKNKRKRTIIDGRHDFTHANHLLSPKCTLLIVGSSYIYHYSTSGLFCQDLADCGLLVESLVSFTSLASLRWRSCCLSWAMREDFSESSSRLPPSFS